MLPPVVPPTLVAITLLSLSLRALGIPLGSSAAAHSRFGLFGFFNSLFPLAEPSLGVLSLVTLVVLLLEQRVLFFMWELHALLCIWHFCLFWFGFLLSLVPPHLLLVSAYALFCQREHNHLCPPAHLGRIR